MSYTDEIKEAVKEVASALKSSMAKTRISMGKALASENEYKMLAALRDALSEAFLHDDVRVFKTCLLACKKLINSSDMLWIVNGLIVEFKDRPKNAAKFLKAIINAGLPIDGFYIDAGPHALIKQVIDMGCVPYKDTYVFGRIASSWYDKDRNFIIGYLLSCKKHRKSVIEAAVTSSLIGDSGDLLSADYGRGKTYLSQLSKRELFTALKSSMETVAVQCVEYYEAVSGSISDLGSYSYSSHSENYFIDATRRVKKMFSERFGGDSPEVKRAIALVRDRLIASAIAYELTKGSSRCPK